MPILSSIEPQETALRCAERAVDLRDDLRHDEQRHALDAGRRAFDARQHQMDDVLRQIVLAGRNEDLGAGNPVAAVGLFHRLGAQEAEIGAAMRLGQIHGAGPAPLDHRRQVGRFLLWRAMREQRRDRALRQAGIHGEGHIGRAHDLVDGDRQDFRQALPAKFGGR